jgi:hypothetical protein
MKVTVVTQPSIGSVKVSPTNSVKVVQPSPTAWAEALRTSNLSLSLANTDTAEVKVRPYNTIKITQGPISAGDITVHSQPGGVQDQIQFNRDGQFQGDANLTFANNTLAVPSIDLGPMSVSSNTKVLPTTNILGIDSFSADSYSSAKYLVNIEANGYKETTEIIVVHDNVDTYITEYAAVASGPSLGDFTASINAGKIWLLFQPTFANTTIRVVRFAVR